MIMDRKKHIRTKLSNETCGNPNPSASDSSISIEENSNYEEELIKNQGLSMYSHAYVQPTATLSDFLFEEDEPNCT